MPTGDAVEVLTPDKSAAAPMMYGFYRQGVPEPTRAGAVYVVCNRSGNIQSCALMVDVDGTKQDLCRKDWPVQ